jgi:carbamate kinase
VNASELKAHYDAGHFPPGNMGPKVESVLSFLNAGGRQAVITSFEYLTAAISGSAGTHVRADESPNPVLNNLIEMPVTR